MPPFPCIKSIIRDYKKDIKRQSGKRDECSDGKITLAEFEEWLEGSFPNRKKKQ